nr:hypothetical protein Ade03nite_94510 [Actinoplanes derwentensis]
MALLNKSDSAKLSPLIDEPPTDDPSHPKSPKLRKVAYHGVEIKSSSCPYNVLIPCQAI